MQLLNLTSSLPVYLPYDYAHVPFGDPFNDVTITSSTTAVVTVPGYEATAGDIVLFTTGVGISMPTGLTANTKYYVVSPSTDTFAVSATKGGSAIATTGGAITASGQVVVHLLSNQVDGVTQPFKTGATVLALSLSGTVTLQGAADTYELAPGSIYPIGKTPPGGPAAYATIATLASGVPQLVTLNYDWINASGGALILLQN
jgi:hypothetical protein